MSAPYARKRSYSGAQGGRSVKKQRQNTYPKSKQVVMSPETNYVDGYLDNTALKSVSANDATWADADNLSARQVTASYGCLPVPAQGDDYSDRKGRKIHVKMIRIKGVITFNGQSTLTDATGQSMVRLVVVKDKQTGGNTLSAENVIGPGKGSDQQATLLADSALVAFSNPAGWGRYQILKDKMYRIPPPEYVVRRDGRVAELVRHGVQDECEVLL